MDAQAPKNHFRFNRGTLATRPEDRYPVNLRSSTGNGNLYRSTYAGDHQIARPGDHRFSDEDLGREHDPDDYDPMMLFQERIGRPIYEGRWRY